ncbi:hypothetical protein ABZ713_34920, partial [Streptomyces sp. NPDC006875]
RRAGRARGPGLGREGFPPDSDAPRPRIRTRRQLSGIERRIDVLQRNRQAIQAYLRACGEAEAATPAAVVGALDRLRRDGPDAQSDVDARRREEGSSSRERQVQ